MTRRYKQRKSKYTKEILEPIVRESFSFAEVFRKLGLSSKGGEGSLRKLIREQDISHFTGQGWLKNRTRIVIPNEKFFVKNSNVSSCKIRNALFKRGLKEKRCENCKLTEWLSKPIPLEVNHKDGDKHNNQLENLEIRCPNCHYFTDNYKSKNWKRAPLAQSEEAQVLKT